MSSPTSSYISQNNTKMLEQQQEMQRRHEEEQRLQVCLEEAAEAHHIEQAT